MLGADVATMASFCLMSNMGVAVAAPVLFAAIGANPELSFLQSVGIILWKVVPLLILPFVCAVLLERFAPRWHKAVRDRQIISFWIWAASLTVVLGRTVEFLLAQPKENYTVEVLLAAVALVICLLQFTLGRYIGRRFGDTVAGGQSIRTEKYGIGHLDGPDVARPSLFGGARRLCHLAEYREQLAVVAL